MAKYKDVKAYRERNKANGKCINCGVPSDGYLRCKPCRAKNYKFVKAHKETLPSRGICATCHKPLPEHRHGMNTCGWCREDIHKLEMIGWR